MLASGGPAAAAQDAQNPGKEAQEEGSNRDITDIDPKDFEEGRRFEFWAPPSKTHPNSKGSWYDAESKGVRIVPENSHTSAQPGSGKRHRRAPEKFGAETPGDRKKEAPGIYVLVWYINKDGDAQAKDSPGWVLLDSSSFRKNRADRKAEQDAEKAEKKRKRQENKQKRDEEKAAKKLRKKQQKSDQQKSLGADERVNQLQEEWDREQERQNRSSRASTPVKKRRGKGRAKVAATTEKQAASVAEKSLKKMTKKLFQADLLSNVEGDRGSGFSTTFALLAIRQGNPAGQGAAGRPAEHATQADHTQSDIEVTAVLPENSTFDAAQVARFWALVAGGAPEGTTPSTTPALPSTSSVLLRTPCQFTAHFADKRRALGNESDKEREERLQTRQLQESPQRAPPPAHLISPLK